MKDRHITIFVRDKHNVPLPGGDVSLYVGGDHIADVKSTEGRASFTLVGKRKPVEIRATYDGQIEQLAKLAEATDTHTFTFNVTGTFSSPSRMLAEVGALIALAVAVTGLFYLGLISNLIPLVLGALLVLSSVVLAFRYPNPTPLQSQLVRSMFALGAGALGSQIPGILSVNWTPTETLGAAATGAMAIYLITFLVVPARADKA